RRKPASRRRFFKAFHDCGPGRPGSTTARPRSSSSPYMFTCPSPGIQIGSCIRMMSGATSVIVSEAGSCSCLCRLGARAAEAPDKHGPELRRYDHWGRERDVVVHASSWTDNKADLVRAGFVGLPWHAGRPVPAVLTAALAYLVCQAETAVYCGLGMTAGAAD